MDMTLQKEAEKQHLEEQKKEHSELLELQKSRYEKRIKLLEKDLQSCQKREEAIKAVFLREFERERELMLEHRRLKAKAAALEVKQKKLDAKAAQLGRKRDSIVRETKKLEDTRLLIEDSLALSRREDHAISPPVLPSDNSFDEEDEIWVHAPGNTYPFTYGDVTSLHLDALRAGNPTISTTSKSLTLLRKHDYYSGWLDAMRSIDHKKAIHLEMRHVALETRRPIAASSRYLADLNDPRNPRNAGINAGLLFAYSAHKSDEVRLDTRTWKLDDLKPLAREDQCGEFAFWEGAEYGVDKMTRLFKLKIERGIWETGEDAAQIALMRTRDLERGYMVVPGRRAVTRDVHRLARRARGDDTG